MDLVSTSLTYTCLTRAFNKLAASYSQDDISKVSSNYWTSLFSQMSR